MGGPFPCNAGGLTAHQRPVAACAPGPVLQGCVLENWPRGEVWVVFGPAQALARRRAGCSRPVAGEWLVAAREPLPGGICAVSTFKTVPGLLPSFSQACRASRSSPLADSTAPLHASGRRGSDTAPQLWAPHAPAARAPGPSALRPWLGTGSICGLPPTPPAHRPATLQLPKPWCTPPPAWRERGSSRC